MTAVLVDTHALIWFVNGDSRLSETGRATIENDETIPLVSVASLWEIAIKSALGKVIVADDLPDELAARGFASAPIEPEHAWRVRTLARDGHKDPFDRLIAAQALVEQLPVISADTQLDVYGVRRIW